MSIRNTYYYIYICEVVVQTSSNQLGIQQVYSMLYTHFSNKCLKDLSSSLMVSVVD